jgi:hypothetical protein
MRTPHLLCAVASVLAPTALAIDAAASTPVEPLPLEAVVAATMQTVEVPSRLELRVATDIPGMTLDGETPLATGEVSGTSAHLVADLSPLLAGAGMPAGVDSMVELTLIGSDLYFRAPLLATVAEMMPSTPGAENPLGALADLGDGWAYLDTIALAAASGADMSTMTSAVNPAQLLELLGSATKTDDLGTETIRGVETTGVRLNLDFSRLIEVTSSLVPDESVGGLGDLDDLAGMTAPIDVWVGDDGYVHRVAIAMDSAAFGDAADVTGMGDFSLAMTIDLFDFGATDIAVEAPADFVDITDSLVELMEMATTAIEG